MKIDRIEFDDPDDPESAQNQSIIKLRFAPESMFICLPNGGNLALEDQQALGKMLRMAYEQGKRVGNL